MDFYGIEDNHKQPKKRKMRGLEQSGSVPAAYFRKKDIRHEAKLLFPKTNK